MCVLDVKSYCTVPNAYVEVAVFIKIFLNEKGYLRYPIHIRRQVSSQQLSASSVLLLFAEHFCDVFFGHFFFFCSLQFLYDDGYGSLHE